MDKYKKKLETLTLQMQHFCLDPKWTIYNEITKSTRLKNEQGAYDAWKLAVLATYGTTWALPKTIVESAIEDFNDTYRRVSARLLIKPSPTNLDNMWYIFFATGNKKHLKEAFEVAGNETSSNKLKNSALDMFQAIQNSYRDKIKKIKDNWNSIDPDFKKLPGLTAFDEFQQVVDIKTKELNELPDDSLLKKFQNKTTTTTTTTTSTTSTTSITIPKTQKEIKLDNANKALDTAIDDIFNKL
jgi:hypothetical protein